MTDSTFPVRPIGYVRSSLRDLAEAPKQGSEGGVEAWIEVLPEYAPALEGLRPGTQLIVLTWLHAARRDLLQVHPRDDRSVPLSGVFRTRSADRPNPIGLHPVTLQEIDRLRLRISPMEVIDGTPVLDLKPVI
jgi:tRNA-Thr(GGU) m(6)t(6)A37 methyltransferase TsaA